MTQPLYPMKVVSQRTGLSPHVLRVWERRYGAVTPARTDSNRRLYGEDDIKRLTLMSRLTAEGHSIRQIAALPAIELESLAATELESAITEAPAAPKSDSEPFLDEAWFCVRDLNSPGLRTILDRASVALGVSRLTRDVIVPLVERIGAGWQSRELSIAEEHAATVVIKEVLFLSSRPYARSTGSPNLVVATLPGQLHELGATLVASEARFQGWDVTYLGASLPATEIARAAGRNRSLAVGLSFVYPGDDPQIPGELQSLRRALPDHVRVIAGGRTAHQYGQSLEEIGAKIVTDLDSLAEELTRLREGNAG